MDLVQALGIGDHGIISVVGSGGKTSLLLSLAAQFDSGCRQYLVTSTTKMYLHQVERFKPFFSLDYQTGKTLLERELEQSNFAAWFKQRQGEKVVGIPPSWVEQTYKLDLLHYALVEADGAQQRLLKAPGSDEPVVPQLSDYTLGVLNLKALGKPLAEDIAHRLEVVLAILGKEAGELASPRDLALLAGSEQGIFRGAKGKKVLVLSGGCKASIDAWQQIVENLNSINQVGICRCVLSEGFGDKVKPIRWLDCASRSGLGG